MRSLGIAFRSLSLSILVAVAAPSWASDRDSTASAKVEVSCTRSSAFVHVNITSFRPIGNVVIEVKNSSGLTLYREEGKALTPELVRRLDKGGFPKGAFTLTVTAKDFVLAQPFTVD